MLLAPTTTSDNKGKSVALSPSESESGYHAESGHTDAWPGAVYGRYKTRGINLADDDLEKYRENSSIFYLYWNLNTNLDFHKIN